LESVTHFGTHGIFIGRVEQVQFAEEAAPLVYQDGHYVGSQPGRRSIERRTHWVLDLQCAGENTPDHVEVGAFYITASAPRFCKIGAFCTVFGVGNDAKFIEMIEVPVSCWSQVRVLRVANKIKLLRGFRLPG
jgi:hypothetical protein